MAAAMNQGSVPVAFAILTIATATFFALTALALGLPWYEGLLSKVC
jgi:hypothetical protein